MLSQRALEILRRNLEPLGIQVDGLTPQQIMAQCDSNTERELEHRIKSGEHGEWGSYARHLEQLQA